MSTRVLVSIIVPSYNQGRFIADTLDSILAQTHRPLEIIVVDGASTDNTIAVLRDYAVRHPEVRWISEKDSGPADAVNKGLALARGDIAAIQSADDLYQRWAVADVVQIMQQHPDCGFVYGDIDCIDGDGRPLGPGDTVPEFSWEAFFAIALCIPQSSIFFHTQLASEAAGWNPEYYSSDLDLWLKLLLRTRAIKAPRPLSIWRMYPGQRTGPEAYGRIWRGYWRMIANCEELREATPRVRRMARASRHLLAFNINPGNRWHLRWHALLALGGHPTYWRYLPAARLRFLLPHEPLRGAVRLLQRAVRLLRRAVGATG